jgi:hypothetical protein
LSTNDSGAFAALISFREKHAMRKSILAAFGAVIAVAAIAAAEEYKWVSLFDGKTLDGWTVRSGQATYRVENGEIVGRTTEGSSNTFLCTNKEYADFTLEFEVKCDPKLNSGVQFRSHAYPKETVIEVVNKEGKKVQRKLPAGRVFGYQVEIASAGSGVSGGIYDEARRGVWLYNTSTDPKASKAFKDNEWNKYRVECRGHEIKTFINGVPCTTLVDKSDLSGIIGLQVHGIKKGTGPYEVRWRNIRIQEIPVAK